MKPAGESRTVTSGIGKGVANRTEKLTSKIANSNRADSENVASQETDAQHKRQPGGEPLPPAVFIMLNGDRLEASRYVLTVHSLRLQQGQTERTIPLSTVNMQASIAANRERGIDLNVPSHRGEITLGF
jgi:hypothetical protein